MYSKIIEPKVEHMFQKLQKTTQRIIENNPSTEDAISQIYQRINSETSSRSKTMLSDMLFDLQKKTMQSPFFSDDISRQNALYALDIQQEILDKYQFETQSIQYQEASRFLQSMKTGGGVCAIGAALLIPASSLAPIPAGMLFAAAIGSAILDYFVIEPNKNKKRFSRVLDQYFAEAQQQYLDWFDEVEKYFHKRVEEIKQTL